MEWVVKGLNFIDRVLVACRAGGGGDGCVHFRRRRNQSQGGADGGRGGKGGDVIMIGRTHHWTLLHLRYMRHLRAQNGGKGMDSNKQGAKGQDAILEVPLGTVARNAHTNTPLGEVTKEGQSLCLLAGGTGGWGNAHFVNARRQACDYAQSGQKGQEASIEFTLKLLGDVGLVGPPNAGKSTLLAKLSAAHPAIAPYPFTSVQPVVGVVKTNTHQSFVMTDLPGIIQGASKGKGLGLQFLQHMERHLLLVFVISCEEPKPKQVYDMLCKELESYHPQLRAKPHLILISKCDLIAEDAFPSIQAQLNIQSVPLHFISSHTRQGLTAFKNNCWRIVKNLT